MATTDIPWRQDQLGFVTTTYLRILHAIPVSPITRRIALWLRKPLKSILPPIVDVRVWNLRLRLRSSGNLSEQRLIHMPQFLDSLERAELKEFLQNGGTFVDIGANAGVYTLWVASTCPQTQVESFEPDPSLCELLQWNLDLNNLNNAHLNRHALGRREGEVRLVSGHGNAGENRIHDHADNGVAVPMLPLATALQQRGVEKIRAMKIDIEGMETDVLEPYFTTAPKSHWPDLIVCEVLKTGETTELLRLLESNGYQMKKRGRMNGLFYRA